MTGTVCSCASPWCVVNGCALYRRFYERDNTAPKPPRGWTCPMCGVVNAPHIHQCGCASRPTEEPTVCPTRTTTAW